MFTSKSGMQVPHKTRNVRKEKPFDKENSFKDQK